MGIIFDKENMIFNMCTRDGSYIIKVHPRGEIMQLYWGKKVEHIIPEHYTQDSFQFLSPNPDKDSSYSHGSVLRDYPNYGNSDFRYPAYSVRNPNGDTITDLKYKSHTITAGKPKLQGLPATFSSESEKVETIDFELCDEVIGLTVHLLYSMFDDLNVIARSARFENTGDMALILLSALSASVDFSGSEYDFLHLAGNVMQERDIIRETLNRGSRSIQSRRGISSHQANPFIAIMDKDADEHHGDVYGFSLVYSGNFIANVEVDEVFRTRVSMGINPFDFSWKLDAGEQFQTPECLLVYSDKGLNKMSQSYHELFRKHLFTSKFKNVRRPILNNNWEATMFRFDEKKIMDIITDAAEAGIEMFVLDDGWFGKRDTDRCSLGDWYVNKGKFPNGLTPVIEHANKKGLKFGLWFEPEMISPDSDLYRKNPDWCLHVQNRSRSESRHQLVLDLSNPDVCDYIVNTLSGILSNHHIEYVKWDMNRSMTEIGSEMQSPDRQKETAHRYVLGLYSIMERLTTGFPDVLFEGCASGGGRFDPGILYYMPQIWTSDNTDDVQRIRIQYGTSVVYPPSSMVAHITSTHGLFGSKSNTTLKRKANVAMGANFGYELDFSKLSDSEKEETRQQISLYKEIAATVQFGVFHRLEDPFNTNRAGWMSVSEDGKEAVAFHCIFKRTLFVASPRLRLKGLDANASYELVNYKEIYNKGFGRPGFGVPPASFGAPPAGFGTPPAGFEAPPAGFGAPPAGFEPPPDAFMPPRAAIKESPIYRGDELVNLGLAIPSSFMGGDNESILFIFRKL